MASPIRQSASDTSNSGSINKSSGRYLYKDWSRNASGQIIGVTRHNYQSGVPADLINTTYRNSDGSKVVYGIVFDLDAERAEDRWKDEDGKLDWLLMALELKKNHKEISKYVTHVVRSTGGKGLALVIAINPLPIRDTTANNQKSGRGLQSRIIKLFIETGFGADPSARGLERDFPNFTNPERLVYRDELIQRRVERERIPVITNLHAYLNKVDAEKRKCNRLYPDARVELGLARLVGWLLGIFNPGKDFKLPMFLSEDEVWATTTELCGITGCGKVFLREFLGKPPEWLNVRYEGREGWRLSIPLSHYIPMLLERSELLNKSSAYSTKIVSFKTMNIPLPHEVQDGERNQWLTQMALTYKWSGYSREATLRKIELRAQSIVGFESSRNCRQLKAIVKSIYANVSETFAMCSYKELPDWMLSDDLFKFKSNNSIGVLSHRRGTPLAAAGTGLDGEKKEGISLVSVPELRLRVASLPISIIEKPETLELAESISSDRIKQIIHLVAIRRKQRIGIFDGNTLVVCLTKHHYRATKLIERLGTTIVEYKDKELKIYTPHKDKHEKYFAAIDAYEKPICGELLCEKRPTKAEKIQDWFEKNKLEYIPSPAEFFQMENIEDEPF